jgi:polyphosphate kinase
MHRDYVFFDRDISWLSFNERVLMEAQRKSVPLLERINFLSIFSSNLDEFYRVRMPALNALQNLYDKEKVNKGSANKYPDVLNRVKKIVSHQQVLFGRALNELVPILQGHGIEFLYGAPLPKEILPGATRYFFTQVLAFLKPVFLSNKEACFFPENNRVYLAVTDNGKDGIERIVIVNIPTDHLSRLFSLEANKKQYIVFLDDIIRAHLYVLPGIEIKNCFSFKVTRDAEIDLDDDYEEDMAEMIERQIAKRDQALATRFLYEPGVSAKTLKSLLKMLGLPESVLVKGGRYHNLKDLNTNLFNLPGLKYKDMPSVHYPLPYDTSLLDHVAKNDILLHTPYHAYDTVRCQ